MAYGSDYKGSWVFLVTPGRAFDRFARGVFVLLWIRGILIPHELLLGLLAWKWGIAPAALFIAYSVAVTSAYLSVELRLIDGVPFSRQPEESRGGIALPVMLAAGFVAAIVVAMQHFVIFRSPALVILTTFGVAATAWLLTRGSLRALGVSMRYSLSQVSNEAGRLYIRR